MLGISVGFMLSTGIDFGTCYGKKEYKKSGDIAKTAMILALAFGTVSTTAMLATKGIFPSIFEEKTANMAGDFFLGYAASAIPLLFLIVGPQIAFQVGEWYVPPISTLSVLVLSGVMSYVLGIYIGMGAFGIGLGGTIGISATAIALGFWLRREVYKELGLFSPYINEFSSKAKSLLSIGWQLSLQRLTEWGNLLIITTIIGATSNNDLKALNPLTLYLVLFGTVQQGFAQAAGMIISKNKGVVRKAIGDNKNDLVEESHVKNIQTIFRSILVGVGLNGILALVFYLARKPLADIFLSDTSDTNVHNLAHHVLFFGILGLIPDAMRIVGAGNLRGWKDLLYPTVVSSIFMTVIGIPVAFGLGKLFSDETSMMFYVRDVSILISGLFIAKKCYNKVKDDEEELGDLINRPSFLKAGLYFFSSKGRSGLAKNDSVASASASASASANAIFA